MFSCKSVLFVYVPSPLCASSSLRSKPEDRMKLWGFQSRISVDSNKASKCKIAKGESGTRNTTLMRRLPAFSLCFSVSLLSSLALTPLIDFVDRPLFDRPPPCFFDRPFPTSPSSFLYQLSFQVLSFLPALASSELRLRSSERNLPASLFRTVKSYENLLRFIVEIPFPSYSLVAFVLRRTRCRQGEE